MAKSSKPSFYAVGVGRTPGVYGTWEQAKKQVDGFGGAKYKKFPTMKAAQEFVDEASATPATASKGKARAMDGEEEAPSAKRQKTSNGKSKDPVFGGEDDKYPKHRIVYSDGSSKGNGQKGAVAGSGVFWSHEPGANNLAERLPGPLQTNNRAEMYAVARILETDPHPEEPLQICTDSKYTMLVFTSYIASWKAKGWRTSTGATPANGDLIRFIMSLIALRTIHASSSSSTMANIKFKWVKGHATDEGNKMADKLACQGAALPLAADRDFEELAKENQKKLEESKGAKVKSIEEITWDVEDDDLLSAEEIEEMEKSQDF
ncbi:hypothetical protein JCM5353_007488 [Sporobolomyces roseus]